MPEEGLAPPFRVYAWVTGEWKLGIVNVIVQSDSIIQNAVVESQRDIVFDIKGAIRVIRAHAGQTQPLGLVAHIHVVLGIVDRVKTHHALVDIGSGVIHAMIVEPEEGLFLARVAACRIVEIQVIAPCSRRVAVTIGTMIHGVVRVAIALRRCMGVV